MTRHEAQPEALPRRRRPTRFAERRSLALAGSLSLLLHGAAAAAAFFWVGTPPVPRPVAAIAVELVGPLGPATEPAAGPSDGKSTRKSAGKSARKSARKSAPAPTPAPAPTLSPPPASTLGAQPVARVILASRIRPQPKPPVPRPMPVAEDRDGLRPPEAARPARDVAPPPETPVMATSKPPREPPREPPARTGGPPHEPSHEPPPGGPTASQETMVALAARAGPARAARIATTTGAARAGTAEAAMQTGSDADPRVAGAGDVVGAAGVAGAGDVVGTAGAGLANPPPHYPYLARRRGIEGHVLLWVAVSPAGRAQSVSIRRSSGHRLLDLAAMEAVERWRFVPARRRGIVVAGALEVPITFKLNDQ